MVNYILLGKPGSGKGTQAQQLSTELALPLISTGSLFYQYSRADTDIGRAIKKVIESGELIDDALIFWVIKETLQQTDLSKGLIIDGIPRRLDQAETLDKILNELEQPDYIAFYINISDDISIKRIAGRRICQQNKEHVFHLIYNPPEKENVCDFCGGELIQRSDDSEEQVKKRLEVFFQETEPLINYYKEKGLLYEVDGEQSIADVHTAVLAIIRRISQVQINPKD